MKKHFFSLITIVALVGSMIFTGCNSLLNKSKNDAKCSFTISEDVARSIYEDATAITEGEEVLVSITVICSPDDVAAQTKYITSVDDFANLSFTFDGLSTENEYDFDVKVQVNETITLYTGSATKVLPVEDETTKVSITLEKAYELAKPALTIKYGDSVVTSDYIRLDSDTGNTLTVTVSPSTGGEYLDSVETKVTLRGGDDPKTEEAIGNGSVEFEIEQGKKYTLFATSKLLDGKFTSGRGEEVSLQIKKQYPTTKYALYNDNYVKLYDSNSLPASDATNVLGNDEESSGLSCADFVFDDSGNFYRFAGADTNFSIYKNEETTAIKTLSSSDTSLELSDLNALYDMESQCFYLVAMSDTLYAAMSDSLSDITIEKYDTSFNKLLSATITRPKDYVFVGRPAVSNNILYVFLADIASEGGNYTTTGKVYLAKVDLSTISETNATLEISTDEDIFKAVTLPTGSVIDIDNIASAFRDSIVMDDYLYVLYSDTYGYVSKTDGKTYVRGAVLKFDTATLDLEGTSGWTDTSTMKIQKTVVSETGSVTYTADFYTPSSEPSSFYGPNRFIAIKPKKLVISDIGLAFYVDDTTLLNYKLKSRVVDFDLQSFAIDSTTSFNEDSGITFGLSTSGVAVNAVAENGSSIVIYAGSDSGISVVTTSASDTDSTATN